MNTRGMHMLLKAAEAASEAFKRHWLAPVMRKREMRAKPYDSPAVKRMRFATQAGDIETIMGTIRA